MNGALQLEVMPGPVGATTAEDRRAAETRRLVDLIHQMPDIRVDKVHHMRRLIARGKPDTPGRIDETVRRLLEEFRCQAGAATGYAPPRIPTRCGGRKPPELPGAYAS